MSQICVPWGPEELEISIPPDWPVFPPAQPRCPPAPEDWKRRLAACLHDPLAGLPIRERLSALGRGRICLIVEDLTRHSPLSEILDVVLKEIRQAGVPDGQMEIVFATGMHPPFSEEQARAKLGPAVGAVPWRFNPWNEPSKYCSLGRVGRVDIAVDRGVAEADLRILIASVSPHLQAGFGGGYKMFFPGCAELSSIRSLHRVGIRRRGQGQLVGLSPDDNPMRSVVDAAGLRLDARGGATFSVQYLLDAADVPRVSMAGDVLPVHRRLASLCAEAAGVRQDSPADILITNAHPRDYDLWQCFKCIPNTCWAARPGGVVICLARCPAGLNEMKTLRWPLSPLATRRLVRLLGPETICSLTNRLVRRLAGDSQWFLRLATQLLARNPIFMVSPKLAADGVRFPGIAIYGEAGEAVAAAGRLLGPGPHRVAVYPAGGASYPLLAPAVRRMEVAPCS